MPTVTTPEPTLRTPVTLPRLPTYAHEAASALPVESAGWVAKAREIGDELKKTAVVREQRNELPVEALRRLRETELVSLLIPKKFGGLGGTFKDAAHVILELSKGDASVGALLGFHYQVSTIPRLFDFVTDAEKFDRASAAHRYFWGNSIQGGEIKEFPAVPLPGGRFVLNGKRKWALGFCLGDVATVMAHRTDTDEIFFAQIPQGRAGITYHDDFDLLGLRLAAVRTVEFVNVIVEPDEVIRSTHGKPVKGFPPFYNLVASVMQPANHLGSAFGALEQGRDYTRTQTRVRGGTGLDSAAKDPLLAAEYGDFWIKLHASLTLLERVADENQVAYDNRLSIGEAELGELAIKSSALRVFSTQSSLDVSSRIFEVTGGSAGLNHHGFDRYWRDIRILSARNLKSYAVHGVGNYVLNHALPKGGSYL